MSQKKEKIIIFLFLFISALSFFSFGFYHLGKFETTDEHLWKYDRIPQYWEAIRNKEWERTYINDKPGVTVAMISGIGLLSEPSPDANQYLSAKNISDEKLFENYNYQQSETTNFRFRLPVLIFSTLSLLAFFYLAYRAFNSYRIALLSTLLIATNPILLGISQIINPDSFFWIFGGLSALSYLALLNTKEKKFIIICGFLMGLALLSKYTAFILFVFFVLSAFGKLIFQKEEAALKINWKTILNYISQIAIIFIISIGTFSLLLPAVFVNPDYLFKGISQFLNLKIILSGIFFISTLAGLIAWKKDIIGQIIAIISKQKNIILSLTLTLFSLIIFISIVNVWLDQKIAPVSELRDLAYINEPKEFNFKPLIDRKDITIFGNIQLYLMESYPFIFSISPILILLTFFITYQGLKNKISKNSYIFFSIATFIIFYFFSTLLAHIVTNARYSILLYPLAAIFGALVIDELLSFFNLKKSKHYITTLVFLFTLGIFSFWILKPFYFSYTSLLLPQEQTIHDSWGHGSYEAATHLNSLPNASELVIWSNTDTVCRFFAGKCLKSRKIDLTIVQPDYFVISKRGFLKEKNHFEFTSNSIYKKDSEYYFKNLDKNYIWQIIINDRPENFIKIVKFEK